MNLNFFVTAESGNFSFKFCKFLKYQYLLLWLEVGESIQAKTGLLKPWLATDKANRSPVVLEQNA